MKAKELMIGDWVKMNCGPARVTAIKEGEIHFVDRVGGGISPCCEGLPLTVEILEKNGWKSQMNGSGDFILTNPLAGNSATVTKTINGFELRNGAFNGLGILYVHQLQHALHLCGIEKEITL